MLIFIINVNFSRTVLKTFPVIHYSTDVNWWGIPAVDRRCVMSCGWDAVPLLRRHLESAGYNSLESIDSRWASKGGVRKKLPMDLSPLRILFWLFCFNKITEQNWHIHGSHIHCKTSIDGPFIAKMFPKVYLSSNFI